MTVISKLSLLVMLLLAMIFGVNMVPENQALAFSMMTDSDEHLTGLSYKSSITRDELIGKTDPGNHKDFSTIPTYMANRANMYLRTEAVDSLISMYSAAKKEGIEIRVISAFRSFDQQKKIWEDKWNGSGNRHRQYSRISNEIERSKAILSYSAMPGTSRHHWGTDIDINSLSNAYFKTDKGSGLYTWMQQHAHKFGFCEPYTEKGTKRETGYETEQWHWSFMPLSEKYLEQYMQVVDYENITGFAGAEKARELNIIEDYVLGISSDCQ